MRVKMRRPWSAAWCCSWLSSPADSEASRRCPSKLQCVDNCDRSQCTDRWRLCLGIRSTSIEQHLHASHLLCYSFFIYHSRLDCLSTYIFTLCVTLTAVCLCVFFKIKLNWIELSERINRYKSTPCSVKSIIWLACRYTGSDVSQ